MVTVKWNAKTKKHYVSHGYEFTKMRDEFSVKVEHLTKGSNVSVTVICDYCNQPIVKTYNDYRQEIESNITRKDCCLSCRGRKMRDNTLEKYGVESTTQLESVRNKIKSTNLERYGVESPSKLESVKEKSKRTNMLRRGVQYPSQSPEVQRKIRNSFYRNGTCRTSSQQVKIYKMLKDDGLNVSLNYPMSTCSLDIALFINGYNIDIEYDGRHWHEKIAVRDRKRDEFLKSEGWKIVRIKGDKTVPSVEDIMKHVNIACSNKNSFSMMMLEENSFNTQI